MIGFVSLFILLLNRNSVAQMYHHRTCDVKTMCYIVFISHSLHWRYIKTALQEYVIIDDILDHADQENSAGILFAVDIEKAFDSVEHNFTFSVLRKFGFGPEFIQWIKTMLCNAKSCVMNNGIQIDILVKKEA